MTSFFIDKMLYVNALFFIFIVKWQVYTVAPIRGLCDE